MATRSLGTLTLDLIAKIGGFERGMNQAERITAQRMAAIKKQAKQLGRELTIAFTAAAAATAYAVKSAIDRADELYNAAQKIGVTTESLSGLEYAAKQAGVGLDELQGALAIMVKTQAAAAQGNDRAEQTWSAFGIAVKDSTGHLRDSKDVLLDWANVFSQIPDGAEKTALAMRVFGKSGAELVPFLNEGRAGITALIAEAERLGLVISDDTGRQADEFNDSVDRLRGSVTGLATDIARELLPYLQQLTDETQEWIDTADGANKISEVFNIIAIAGGLVKSVIQGIVDVTQALVAGVIGSFHQLRGGLRLLRLDVQGAAGDFLTFLNQRDAMVEALSDTFGGVEKKASAPRVAFDASGVGAAALGGASGGRGGKEHPFLAAMRTLNTEQEKGKKTSDGASEAKRRAAQAARDQAEAERDLAEAVAKVAEANLDFTRQLEDLRDDQAGPQAEAKREYERSLAALNELHKEGERPVSELREAEKLLAEAYAETTAEIERRMNPGKQVLADLQFELDLTNMLTDAERDRAVFLRENINATEEQADAYARMRFEIDETRKQISAMDEFRDDARGIFEDILQGSESAIGGLKKLGAAFANIVMKMAADWAAAQLFGQNGTSGGGMLGGLLGSLLGGGFGGGGGGTNFGIPLPGSGGLPGFAAGGRPPVGTPYWVGENGRELRIDDRPGTIIPARESARLAAGGRNLTQNNTWNVAGVVDRRTRHQIEQDTYRGGRRALRTIRG